MIDAHCDVGTDFVSSCLKNRKSIEGLMDNFLDSLGILSVQSFVVVKDLKEATEYLLRKYAIESPAVETLIVIM